MSFKYHINNHFSGCRLLAKTFDVYRHRQVNVYMLPGTFDHVGACDGTDAWIAPVAADPFKVNIREILGKIQSGQNPAVMISTPTGRLIEERAPEFQEFPKTRRRLAEEPSPPRRRILATEPQPTQRRRLQS